MRHAWITNIPFIVLAGIFFGLGLRGILTRKAFVIPAHRMLWVLLGAMLPIILTGADLYFESDTHFLGFMGLSLDSTGLVLLAMVGFVFLMAWKKTSGYFAFGITDEYLQNALYAALRKLNLPFEESLSHLRLTTLGADINASVQPTMGTAQIIVKQSQYKPTLKHIAQAMNEYFATVPGKVNLTIFFHYCVSSILLGIYVICF